MDILHKVPPALWLQFPASDSEASVRARFVQLHGCEPERVCEVHLGSNKFILAEGGKPPIAPPFEKP